MDEQRNVQTESMHLLIKTVGSNTTRFIDMSVYVQMFMHLWHHLGHQFPFWLDNSPILSFPWDSELLLITYLWCPSCHIVHKLEWMTAFCETKLCAVWVTWALLKASLQSTIINIGFSSCTMHPYNKPYKTI